MALDNKLGLTSSADLVREEERISKKKALELFENGIFDKLEAGKFSALKAIHKYLFDEIYESAVPAVIAGGISRIIEVDTVGTDMYSGQYYLRTAFFDESADFTAYVFFSA